MIVIVIGYLLIGIQNSTPPGGGQDPNREAISPDIRPPRFRPSTREKWGRAHSPGAEGPDRSGSRGWL